MARNDSGTGDDFHLPTEERARLRQDIDLDALERLLAALPPKRRPQVLDALRARAGRGPPFTGPIWIPPKPAFREPHLRQMLEAVYAPVRARLRGHEEGPPLPPEWRDHVSRPFVLAVVRTLGEQGRVVARVLHRPVGAGGDAVVLSESLVQADGPEAADVLAAAVHCLVGLRSSDSEYVTGPRTVSLNKEAPVPHLPRRTRRALDLCFVSLAREPARRLGSIGRGRAVEVRLRRP